MSRQGRCGDCGKMTVVRTYKWRFHEEARGNPDLRGTFKDNFCHECATINGWKRLAMERVNGVRKVISARKKKQPTPATELGK